MRRRTRRRTRRKPPFPLSPYFAFYRTYSLACRGERSRAGPRRREEGPFTKKRNAAGWFGPLGLFHSALLLSSWLFQRAEDIQYTRGACMGWRSFMEWTALRARNGDITFFWGGGSVGRSQERNEWGIHSFFVAQERDLCCSSFSSRSRIFIFPLPPFA